MKNEIDALIESERTIKRVCNNYGKESRKHEKEEKREKQN